MISGAYSRARSSEMGRSGLIRQFLFSTLFSGFRLFSDGRIEARAVLTNLVRLDAPSCLDDISEPCHNRLIINPSSDPHGRLRPLPLRSTQECTMRDINVVLREKEDAIQR